MIADRGKTVQLVRQNSEKKIYGVSKQRINHIFTRHSAVTVMIQLHSSSDIYHSAKVEVACSTSRISPWLSSLAYILVGGYFLPLFFRQIKIIGQENIPTSGPIILAPTHRARWDSLLIAYAAGRCVTKRDLRFMVMLSECQGLQGWFVKRLGGFPVDVKRPSISSLRHGVELLQQQEILVIFPEGGIFRGHNVQQLKQGTARLALTAESNYSGLGVQILPIAVNYSQLYPQWGSEVSIHIGSAIKASDYVKSCVKQDAKRLTIDLTKALQQLSIHEPEVTSHTFAEIPNS